MSTIQNLITDQVRSFISTRFLKPGFDFWFSDHEHIRCPFPKEILDAVEERTSLTFFEWINGQREDELEKMDDQEMVEMFETILFNEALKLVSDEDQQLTISYPFLPRIGDQVRNHLNETGAVTHRKAVSTQDNKSQMELTVFNEETGIPWQTRFELSA